MFETEPLRLVPKVDAVLHHPALASHCTAMPHGLVLRVVQEEVDAFRARLRQGDAATADRPQAETLVARAAARRLQELSTPGLRRVINATGVILHTNLGRAVLSEQAVRAVAQAAAGYSNLEYDLARGERASRMDHVAPLMAWLFGAEAALAVNNNAAAVLLAVDTLGAPGVVISRGELVEIGDSFRLPDILARSRAPIREIGTTNRTTPADYEAAATPGCVFLKVHRSNFSVSGFTREASVPELVEVARRCQGVVVYDLGAGAIDALDTAGFRGEPDVRGALRAGCDLVTMSGDKLIGGPQAGLLAGRREVVEALRRNPLTRALRIDKLTLAALQATLLSYASSGGAEQEVPALRSLLTPLAAIEARARRLWTALQGTPGAEIEVAPGTATAGGGSFADLDLPSFEVRVQVPGVRGSELLARLRTGEPAVVGRVKDDWVGLDVRCVADEEIEPLAGAVRAAVTAGEQR